MTARPISTTINNVKNQGPACLDPPVEAGPEEQPAKTTRKRKAK